MTSQPRPTTRELGSPTTEADALVFRINPHPRHRARLALVRRALRKGKHGVKRVQSPRPSARPSISGPAEVAAAGVADDLRRRMIAEAAYLRAAQRGFCGGDTVCDWLEAEREIDQRLAWGDPTMDD